MFAQFVYIYGAFTKCRTTGSILDRQNEQKCLK